MNNTEIFILTPEQIATPQAASCYHDLVSLLKKMKRHGVRLVISREFGFDWDNLPVRRTNLNITDAEDRPFATAATITELLPSLEPEEGQVLHYESTFEADLCFFTFRLLGEWPRRPVPDVSIRGLLSEPWMREGEQVISYVEQHVREVTKYMKEKAKQLPPHMTSGPILSQLLD